MTDDFSDIIELGEDGQYIVTLIGVQTSSRYKDKIIAVYLFAQKEIGAINKDKLCLYNSQYDFQSSIWIKCF